MDVPKEQEQAEHAKPSERLTTAKVKDPKKQESGRKGAAARRQNLEVLTAELAAAKKAVFSCEATNNEKHTVDTKNSKMHVSSDLNTTEGSSGEGWSVGIGLAVAAGVVLFAVNQFSQQTEKRVLISEGSKPAPVYQQPFAEQFVQQTSTTCSRSMLDME